MGSNLDIQNLHPSETQKRFLLLHQITSKTGEDLQTQIDFALKVVADLLDMDLAILSHIIGEQYIIKNYYPDVAELEKGQVFELGNTYCSITLQQDGPFGITHMKESEYHTHPCYELFQLESYLGIPVYVGKELYGTINFSSPTPRKQSYLHSDYALLEVLSDWIGNLIRREQIEESLKQKTRQFELITTNTADLATLHDATGTYLFISPSVKRILGYEIDELLGHNHYELVHPEDVDFLKQEPHKKLLNGELVENIQYRIRKKSGEYTWFESSVMPIMNEKGEPIQLQSVSRDITDRKRMEYLFSEAQKMANVGGWEYDLQTGKLYWTDEVYRIHDKEPGTPVFVEEGLSYFPAASREKIEQAITEATTEGKRYDLRLEFISAKGVRKWVRAIGQAIMENGQAVALMGTFQDISKQIEFEQKVLAQNEQLNRNDEIKKKLYSIIAHDLRGAFSGIIGLLNLTIEEIEEEQIPEEQMQSLHLIVNSAKNAHELLENLLRWIQYQDSELIRKEEDINLQELLNTSINLLRVSSGKKNIEIRNEVKPQVVKGDRNMLDTVFRNILSNAIKFSRPGSHILIESGSLNNRMTEVRVQDFGIGMSPDVIRDLFRKEKRPQRSGTMQEKGTGLGLILCKELIEIHQGSIRVESEEGKGSCFIIELPVQNQSQD